MTWGQLCLPVFVGARIAPAENALELLIGPRVQVDGFDTADVGAHSTVDARAANAHKDTEIPGGPSRMLVTLAVRADLVGLQLQEALNCRRVLGCPLSGGIRRPSRHGGFVVVCEIGGFRCAPPREVSRQSRN